MTDNEIFYEAINGFGFVEVKQSPEGVYCSGCCKIHKRPTKLYSCDRNKNCYCRYYVIKWFNPEES